MFINRVPARKFRGYETRAQLAAQEMRTAGEA